MWRGAQSVVIITSPTTPAKTGTAPNVRVQLRATGWRRAPRTCCRSSISTSSSRCKPRLRRSLTGTKRRSMAFCSKVSQWNATGPRDIGERRNGDDDCGRPQAHGGASRHNQRPSHLGIGADPPPAAHGRPGHDRRHPSVFGAKYDSSHAKSLSVSGIIKRVCPRFRHHAIRQPPP